MILFLCKKNDRPNGYNYSFSKTSGLYNSTKFIVDGLVSRGVPAKLVEVNDNNDIDREVVKAKATAVVIEALWVVPTKFDQLKALHPKVRWFVHLHSNTPFLALEGIAIEWVYGYAARGVGVIANSEDAYKSLKVVLGNESVIHLNNVYEANKPGPVQNKAKGDVLDIACFGAIRPMKNQLIQAIAAIKFAHLQHKRLNFYVNSTRSETGGDPVLKNLRALFAEKASEGFGLVEVPWLSHHDFKLALSYIDISMQVSLSETFNVVVADSVRVGVPVVTSSEIEWVSRVCWADTGNVDFIVEAMYKVYYDMPEPLIRQNQWLLNSYSERSLTHWVNTMRGL